MKKLIVILVGAILAVVLLSSLGAAGFYYRQYKSELKNRGKTEVDLLVEQVSQLMDLPMEVPTVATVTDKSKLEEQPFFQSAQNGDKVIIYQQAQKAILFRPSIGKIVDVAPVRSIDQVATPAGEPTEASPSPETPAGPTPTPAPTPTPEPTPAPISVVLYNGTENEGITFNLGDNLMEQFPDLRIIDRDYAARRDYEKTIVVNLSGNNQDQAQAVAQSLHAEVDVLPEGEIKPEADLVVIVGLDQE